MTVDISVDTIVTVLVAGFGGHYVIMTLAINYAVSRLGSRISDEYVKKVDFDRRIQDYPIKAKR